MLHLLPSVAAQVLKAFINRHPVKPSGELRPAGKLADFPKHLQEHLPRDVRGILMADHAHGQSRHLFAMLFVKSPLRLAVAKLAICD